MKTSLPKRLFCVFFIFFFFFFLNNSFGDNSPFKLEAKAPKDRISVQDRIPVSVFIFIEPNHMIYKDQLKINSAHPAQYKVLSVELPPGKRKRDPFLDKEVSFYEERVEIKTIVQLQEGVSPGPFTLKLKVHYQGCSDTICFAPKTEELVLPVQIVKATETPVKKEMPTFSQKEETQTEVSDIQRTIESKGLFLSLVFMFFAGVGLSFTPCVYPMIPITVAVIGGRATDKQSGERKPLESFFLSLIYVLGISIVYAALGVGAASTGALFGAALQSPWVIGFVVAVFVGLAMSMFGVYYLRVPSFISDRLGSKAGKGFVGVFLMGLISGIVASPCIGPVLASLLVYIASTGNKFLGFWMLFVFAWGLGVILIVLGTFSGAVKSLPKSGVWMQTVERMFGLLLIGAALYYLRLIIPQGIFIIILGLFLIVVAVFSGGFDRLTHESTVFQRVRKSFGLVAFIFGMYFLVGLLITKGFILPSLFSTTTTTHSTATQEEINWILSEEKGLKKAKEEGKVAIIDFWASWCSACMELEEKTYTDPGVIRESKKFVNIKIDCTNSNDPKIKKLWKKYNVVGLPTILFVDNDGTVMKDKTITGFVNADKYLDILRDINTYEGKKMQ